MPKTDTAADAWDDDWETLADKQEGSDDNGKPSVQVKISKAERKAKHAESNRQIWESAENPPEPLLFLQTRDNVPLKTAFKPNVTVLARKPPQVLSRNNALAGISGRNLDDDDDSEEERRKANEASFEERKIRAQKERAEKERKYAEAREKLFGSPTISNNSRGTSPNKTTRGKGRGRGGRDNQSRSSNEQSPARSSATGGKQLYDPSYSPMPNSIYIQKKENGGSRPGTPKLEKPFREPRGPQAGRGFASRGAHAG